MTESQSRYSIVERLTSKKLDIINSKTKLTEEVEEARYKVEKLKADLSNWEMNIKQDIERTKREKEMKIKDAERVETITQNDEKLFEIKTNKETYISKTVLVTTGSHRRKLTAKNADKLEHRGITYCATCDGPLFSNKDVIVVGGGNAGFETASQLLAYAKSVTLLDKNEKPKADEITVKKVLSNPNMKLISNAKITEILGDKFVTGLIYEDAKTG